MSTQALRAAFATSQRNASIASARAVQDPDYRIEVLRTSTQLALVAPEWRRLERRTPEATGFQSPDWCGAWMRAHDDAHNDSRDRWRIVTVREGARLVAVLPLQRGRLCGARTLGWLGEPWTQYGDVIVADDASRPRILARAWREILSHGDVDVVTLGRVRADAAIRALPALADCRVVSTEHAPFVSLRANTAAEDRAGKARGKSLRQRRRRLERECGPVTFTVSPNDARDTLLRQAIGWKRDWLRARGLASSGLFHERTDAFVAALSQNPDLVVGRLGVGAETAALEIGLCSPGGYRSLLGAHAPRFANGSPGHLLIAEMIAWAAHEGGHGYDLMVPADTYKQRWADGIVSVEDHAFVVNARGALAFAWLKGRPRAKRAYAALPAGARACVARTAHFMSRGGAQA